MRGDPSTRAVINEIVQRLVARLAPQQIILFGSYAYGEPDPDSDIDLLVIVRTAENFLDRVAGARRAASGAHPRMPFDPIVLTPEEVRHRLVSGDQFLAEIMQRGEVLHAG